MTHTILYFGNYELNHHLLTPDTTTRVNASGGQTSVKPPSKKVDGIVFGYMEEPYACYAVKVGHVVLRRPLKIDEAKHMDGKSFGPSASLFSDRSARNLLDDIIAHNPSQENDLKDFYRQISPDVAAAL